MNTRYILSMLFVAGVSASAVMVGQSVAAEKPTTNCVSIIDYERLSQEELDKLIVERSS